MRCSQARGGNGAVFASICHQLTPVRCVVFANVAAHPMLPAFDERCCLRRFEMRGQRGLITLSLGDQQTTGLGVCDNRVIKEIAGALPVTAMRA